MTQEVIPLPGAALGTYRSTLGCFAASIVSEVAALLHHAWVVEQGEHAHTAAPHHLQAGISHLLEREISDEELFCGERVDRLVGENIIDEPGQVRDRLDACTLIPDPPLVDPEPLNPLEGFLLTHLLLCDELSVLERDLAVE